MYVYLLINFHLTLQDILYQYKQVIVRHCILRPQGLHQLVDQDSAQQQLLPVTAERPYAHHRQFRYHRQLHHEVLDAVADDLGYWFQDALSDKKYHRVIIISLLMPLLLGHMPSLWITHKNGP
jgi:hypothetical protein